MDINATNLSTLFVSFNAAFSDGLGSAPSNYAQVATTVPSSTKSSEYGWLGKMPKMREWLGDRVIHGLASHGYTIRNKPFEVTVGVDRDDIEDDNLGIYKPLMTDLGESAGEHPDDLVFSLLKAGASTLCYDGQYFFDTDHPVIGADGKSASQSNYDANSGSGTAWYLLDTRRALKPIIFQQRKAAQFVALDSPTDPNVFMKKELLYGVDSRCNVGYGFWQQAYCSKKDLTEDNLVAAYQAMTERKGENGRTLGIKPSLLVVTPGQKFDAMKLVSASTMANGATNVMKGLVEVLDDPRLV